MPQPRQTSTIFDVRLGFLFARRMPTFAPLFERQKFAGNKILRAKN
jgi:hypothetical protein